MPTNLPTISWVLPTVIQCCRKVLRNLCLGTLELRSLGTLELRSLGTLEPTDDVRCCWEDLQHWCWTEVRRRCLDQRKNFRRWWTISVGRPSVLVSNRSLSALSWLEIELPPIMDNIGGRTFVPELNGRSSCLFLIRDGFLNVSSSEPWLIMFRNLADDSSGPYKWWYDVTHWFRIVHFSNLDQFGGKKVQSEGTFFGKSWSESKTSSETLLG